MASTGCVPTNIGYTYTQQTIAHGIALFLILMIVDIATTLVFLGIRPDVVTDLTAWDVFWSVLYLWPIVMAFGMISLFLGTFTPSRRIAALTATIVVVIGYFGSNLSSQVSVLEALKPFFLFTYLDSTANLWVNGPQISDVLTLLGVALVAYLLGLAFFQIRDITVGAWPWQRGRIPAEAKRAG